MRVLHSFEELHTIKQTIVYALGTFDGIHKGHQAVIGAAVEQAKKVNAVTVVFTFDTHPLSVLAPHKKPKTILPRRDMEEVVAALGVDYVLELPVSQETLAIGAQDFLIDLTDGLSVAGFVMGENFSFGAKGQGSPEFLGAWAKDKGYSVSVQPLLLCSNDQQPISSTLIRKAVEAGDFEEVQSMLGRPFSFSGTVIKGDQRGRTLGFPTLNLLIPEGLVTPPDGVYANRVRIGQTWYGGVGNVGDNPTFTNQYHRCEVHVFDFDQDIYGQDVKVEFIAYIRGEVKFSNLDQLIEQMDKDQNQARQILASLTR